MVNVLKDVRRPLICGSYASLQTTQYSRPNFIKRVSADGAYDSKENFEYLDGKGIEPAIKTRKNSSTKARGSPARARHVREMKELSYEGWRDKYRYGQRWMAESFFSGVKRTFGETTRAKSAEGMFQEVKMKFSFYNALIGL